MIERSILAKPSSSYDSSQRLASIPLPLRRTMTRGEYPQMVGTEDVLGCLLREDSRQIK